MLPLGLRLLLSLLLLRLLGLLESPNGRSHTIHTTGRRRRGAWLSRCGLRYGY
jgi:hypothetical protein